MKIRDATEQDLRAWFDGTVEATTRAIVLEDNGEVLAVAGISRMGDHMQAWSALDDKARVHKVTLGRMAVEFKKMLTGPVFALCSQSEPTAPGLLAHLGFQPLNDRMWRYG